MKKPKETNTAGEYVALNISQFRKFTQQKINKAIGSKYICAYCKEHQVVKELKGLMQEGGIQDAMDRPWLILHVCDCGWVYRFPELMRMIRNYDRANEEGDKQKRFMQVLHILLKQPGLNMTEVSHMSGIPSSTVYDIQRAIMEDFELRLVPKSQSVAIQYGVDINGKKI